MAERESNHVAADPAQPAEEGRRPHAAWVTFGCRVNQYDTQVGRERFAARGCESIEFAWGEQEGGAQGGQREDLGEAGRSGVDPDVLVVNTCTITARAGARGRQALRSLRRKFPQSTIVATGCHARLARDELAALPEVDHVIDDITRADLDDILPILDRERAREHDDRAGISRFAGRTRPYVKVQEGCDAHCTYCVVPQTRGDMRSRSGDEIVDEIHRLIEAGHREVVIAGIHVGAYGRDLGDGSSLASLLRQVHERCPGLERLRLSSIEPFEFTDDLLGTLGELDRFAPHLHIPLQHADDGVLRTMNRRYGLASYLELLDRLRTLLDDPGISTDIITGFPTEDASAHRRLVGGLERAGFDRVHLFPFSPRPGTPAARLAERHSPEGRELEERRQELLHLSTQLAERAHQRRVGEVEEVLVESAFLEHGGRDPSGASLSTGGKVGYSGRFHRVRLPASAGARGTLVRARIQGLQPAQRAGGVPTLFAVEEPARVPIGGATCIGAPSAATPQPRERA